MRETCRASLFLPTTKSSQRRGNDETRGEERRAIEDWTNETPPVSYLPPTCTHASTRPAAARESEREEKKKDAAVAEGEEARWEVFHQRNPRARSASSISARCTTGLPSDGSHDLIPASPSDGALRKLTLVGQTTMCNRMCDFASHLSARFKWTRRGIELPMPAARIFARSRLRDRTRPNSILSRHFDGTDTPCNARYSYESAKDWDSALKMKNHHRKNKKSITDLPTFTFLTRNVWLPFLFYLETRTGLSRYCRKLLGMSSSPLLKERKKREKRKGNNNNNAAPL